MSWEQTRRIARHLAWELARAAHRPILIIEAHEGRSKDLALSSDRVGVLRWNRKNLPRDRGEWIRRLAEHRLHFGQVILATEIGNEPTGLREIAEFARHVILCLPATEAARYQTQGFIQQIKRPVHRMVSGGKSWHRVHLPPWLVGATFIDDSGSRRRGLARLARQMAGQRVGVALSAGGAKGLAHIGVIQVLEEEGIEIDAVAGCSMGAYVGACWCHGYDGRGLEDLAGTVTTRKQALQLADPSFPPRRGFIRGLKAKVRLNQSLDGAYFHDLKRPLHIVATDLDTLAAKIWSEGHVASAVHASMAIPGICTPVIIDERPYTDGGVSDPLPVRVLEDLGINKIIAVNTHPSLEDLEILSMRQGHRKGSAWTEAARVAGRLLNQHLNYFAKGNLLDTVMRGLQASQVRLAENLGRRADVYIHAYPSGTAWYAFDAYAQAIEAGRLAAQRQLPALRALTATHTRS